MKIASLLSYSAATICLIFACSAASLPLDSVLHPFEVLTEQSPLKDFIMPPSDDTVSTGVIISDVLGKTQSIAIFSGLCRDIDAVSSRLDTASKNATVLAPSNTVMKGLKRKPWEDPEDYNVFGESAYEGGSGEDRAKKNLKQFVESHVVPQSPWEEGSKVKTLSGKELWWENKDGKKMIQPADVEVTSIADKVNNGEVWIIGGSLA